jgi:hypothetical protein
VRSQRRAAFFCNLIKVKAECEACFFGSLHLSPILMHPQLLKPLARFIEASGTILVRTRSGFSIFISLYLSLSPSRCYPIYLYNLYPYHPIYAPTAQTFQSPTAYYTDQLSPEFYLHTCHDLAYFQQFCSTLTPGIPGYHKQQELANINIFATQDKATRTE